MSRRKNSALRKEQEQFTMISNKHNQAFYQKHTDSSNTINFNKQRQKKNINLVPKTINQENYILALTNTNTDIVVVSGPAGTGKTYLAVISAIKALREQEIDRIILTRPAVAVDDERHGFLPGDLNAKMEPWTRPLLDVLREFYTVKELEYMLQEQVIEISPLAYMRGRSFKNSWIILDEAQNATPNQIKMLMTRIDSHSKIIITGDIEQTDRKKLDNGLWDLNDRLGAHPVTGIEVCKFDTRDVQRHKIIPRVIDLYNK